jgi:AcrR family transcriptional regulator
MSLLSQTRSLETRQQILTHAARLFARNGFDATGVAEICASAGVSKGAFYYHFPSKHAVFSKLLDDWLASVNSRMEGISRDACDTADSLVTMTGLVPGIFEEAGDQFGIFLEFWTQANRDPQVWASTIAPYHRYIEYFKQKIQEGVNEGSMDTDNPDTLARIIVPLALGVLLQGMLDPKSADWGRVAADGMKLLVKTQEGVS